MNKEGKPPEWVNKYFENNKEIMVKSREYGSYCFWYKQRSGHYKTVCRTRFTHKNKWIKHKWFKIKVFFYKLTHNTSYHSRKFYGAFFEKDLQHDDNQ